VDALAWIITVLWSASWLLDAFRTDYDPEPTIHIAMLAVVGVAFGTSMIRRD
jgi:hypothetical protein